MSLTPEKQAEYDRLQAAKAEAKVLKAWRDAGEEGERPATPNLDEIDAAHAKPEPVAVTEPKEAPMPKPKRQPKAAKAKPEPAEPATTDDAPSERLASGALRGLVLEYIKRRPRAKDGFSPGAIASDLTRSSGAVRNALDKLVAAGELALVSDKPRLYGPVAKSSRKAS